MVVFRDSSLLVMLDFITIVTMSVPKCYSSSTIGSSNSDFIAFHKHERLLPLDWVMTSGHRGLPLLRNLHLNRD